MADKTQTPTQYIESELLKYGIVFDKLALDASDENRKKYGNMTDTEIINKSYEGRESELLENVLGAVARKIQDNKTYNNNEINSDVFEQFQEEPSSESLIALKKHAIKDWKRHFKKGQAAVERGVKLKVSYSNEDLNEVLSGLDIAYDFDYFTIKALEEETKLNELEQPLRQKTDNFCRELELLCFGLKQHQEMFEKFQKECKTIGEFDEKMDQFLATYKKEFSRDIFEQDKLVFDLKRDLEQAQQTYGAKLKKTLSYFENATKARDKLLERREKDKNSPVFQYYGELETFFKEECPDVEGKNCEAKSIVFYENLSKFNNELCPKQLKARQDLKDYNKEMENFKKVSHEEERKAS